MTTNEECRFFVPGPTWVRPEILREMTRPMIGHRTPEFRELFHGINADLKPVFRTSQTTLVATCTGTGLMQAALENCVARRVLITTCGAFSERWLAIAESLGYEVDRVDAPWGKAIDVDELADHLTSRRGHYDAVTITHNETSTGVTNDVAALAAVVHEEAPDTLVLVDAVSSLGSMPVEFDQWRLDVCLASVQKGLALPPGVAVAAVSERALECAKKHPYRGTYFDFLKYVEAGAEDSVPSTPSLPHFYGLAAELHHILREEGLEARFERHRKMRDLTIARTAKYAKLASDPDHASTSVTALAPLGDPKELREAMKQRGFTLGGGYGQWKDTTFRIGHMGDIPVDALETMLDALGEVARA